MKPNIRKQLVEFIDEFMGLEKTLGPELPSWSDSGRRNEDAAKWPIIEPSGISRAHVRFRLSRMSTNQPSISVIFSGHMCYRIDVKPDVVCEPNPLVAMNLGYPAMVCGTHRHTWMGNREHILKLKGGEWDMPVREDASQDTRRIQQALAVLATDVRINLTSEQRTFNGPVRRDLF